MKKTILFSSALVALAMLASCQKEKFIEAQAPATGVTEFTATIEPPTKTAIDASDGKFTWTAGDEITVTDAASKSAVYVASSSGASTKFNLKQGEKAVGDGPYTASYGAYDTQIYSPTGANCPLTAATSDAGSTTLHFSSPYAVLRITATSEVEKTIKEVEITSNGSHYNYLHCDKGKDSVTLSDTSKVFYIAVGETTFESLGIKFITEVEEATRTRTSALTLKAGDLLPLTLNFIESDWKSSCIAAGTMITMENGGQKAVEEIEVGDVIRTVNHETGEVSSAPVCFVWETKNVSNAFTLTFEDGVEVTVIEEHGFYDQEERQYAFINANNAKDYIGHHFFDADNNRWLELKSCKPSNGSVDAYAIVTSKHLNHLSNGVLSICDGTIKILANIFEYDEQLKFDAAKKVADIEKYGLTPREKILEYKGFLEADYDDYNLMYLNVAVGKGLTSWDVIKAISDYFEANNIY